MQRIAVLAAAVVVSVVLTQYAVSQAPPVEPPATQPVVPAAPAGLLDILRPGDTVGLELVQNSYRIVVNPRWRSRDVYTVVLASQQGVILETQNRDTQLRVPITSILEVVVSSVGVRS